MAELTLGSPWAPYGLRDDPFFQQPLQPVSDEDALWPITLFVGRKPELKMIAQQVLGSSASRAIIEGGAGVGKTSFVSRIKSELGTHGVLTHTDPVRVRSGMTDQQFMAEVLKVLLQIRATVAAENTASPIKKAGRALKQDAALDTESAFWRRVGRLIQGEDSISGGMTVMGVGGQRGHTRIPAEIANLSLFDELAKAVAYLAKNGKKVLVHVNNLENLTLEATADAARLMQQIRDCFLIDGSHWLFVGTTGIERQIFRASEQVNGIVPFAVQLGPLAPDEVAELLRRRYIHLQKGIHLTPPIDPNDGATLYRRYDGELRTFLSLLSSAVQRHSGFAPGVPLAVDVVVSTMAPTFRIQTLLRLIGEADAAHLEKALGGKSFDHEFRVTDLAKAIGMAQASASKFAQRLIAANVIRKRREVGKSVFYQIANGDLTVALGMV